MVVEVAEEGTGKLGLIMVFFFTKKYYFYLSSLLRFGDGLSLLGKGGEEGNREGE